MKKILSLAIKLTVSSILLYFFISRVNVHSILETLSHLKIPLFILGFLVYLLTVFISTKRWSLFLPQGIKYTHLLSLYFVGSFFNTFLPGIVGGDAVKTYYLYKHTGRGGLSFVSVFMDRYMGLIAMTLISLVALIAGYQAVRGTEIELFIIFFLIALSLASLAFWSVNWGRIGFLKVFYAPLMEYKSQKKIIYKGLFLGFIIQGLCIFNVYLLSLSIGMKVPVVYFFIFVPIISIASSIPVSVAGLGIREAAYVLLFSKVGVLSAEALSLSLLAFSTICLVNLIGGAEYLRIGKPPEKERS
ncbi:MAG: flippase-like domain-containing protein [Nitrospirae bacterium]|nr:flippase-like domain-containing protein [Nitrospirota bacterium]